MYLLCLFIFCSHVHNKVYITMCDLYFSVNFGFVTYERKDDAYQAVEHGNEGHFLKYHLSFGGRRAFCQASYADLGKN